VPAASRRGGGTARERGLWYTPFCSIRRPSAHRKAVGGARCFGWRRASARGGSGGRWSASDVPAASHEEGKALCMEDCGERWSAAAFTEKGAATEQGTDDGENFDPGRLIGCDEFEENGGVSTHPLDCFVEDGMRRGGL
jgi:hypothetical protein